MFLGVVVPVAYVAVLGSMGLLVVWFVGSFLVSPRRSLGQELSSFGLTIHWQPGLLKKNKKASCHR